MGKALAKQITGMSWRAKISLVLLCTLVLSVFMYEGWYQPKNTQAAVAALNSWVNLSQAAPALSTGTYAAGSITATAGTNRVLLVGVAIETSAATTMTSLSASVGGTALTLLKSTAATSGRSHAYVGYLLNSQIPAAASAVTVTYNTGVTATTVTGLDVKWATYSGVNQTTPFTSSNAVLTATATATFGTAISYGIGGQTFFFATNGGNPATITNPTGFTSIAAATNTATSAQSSFVSQDVVATVAGSYAATLTATFTGTTSTRSALVVASLNPSVAAPTVTTIAPSSIVSGTATSVTITGTNLTGASVTFPNGTVGTITSNSGTVLVVPITGTTVGTGIVTVTTTGGSSTGNLSVTAAVPTVSILSPTSMNQGVTAQTLTITGTNLTGATLAMSGTGVTLGTATVTATSITVPVTITAAATAGARTLTVTTAGGSATASFTVNAVTPAPTITSVTPSSVVQGTLTSVTIVGTNLTGATVTFSNGTAGTATVTATSITVNVTGSTVGTGTVGVTTTGGSASTPFTVTAAPVNPTTVGAMSFPTIAATSLGVQVAYSGDSNANNSCVIKWGTVSGTYPNTVTATKGSGVYSATATGLTLGVTYYFQATFTDADGVTGTNPVTGSAVTSSWSNSPLLHNSTNLNSTKWAAGWGVPGGQYGAFVCSTCHNQTTSNIKRVAAKLPAVFAPVSTINFKSVTTPNGFGDDSVTHTTSTKVCEVCHTLTKYHNRNSASSTSLTHNNNADCTGCHVHNKGFAASNVTCDTCHGNPPTTATTGGTTGLATNALATGQAGAHAIHVTTEGFTCNLCHNGSASAMPGGSLEIGFAINPTNAPGFTPTISTGAYVGNSAMTGTTWASSSTGTTVTTAAGVNTCAIYCHGATLLSGTTANPVASWVAGSTERACGSCHGVTSASVPGAVGKTNSHTKHVGTYNFACTKCHTNAGTTASVNYAHVNGSVQWRLSTGTGMIRSGATYNGAVSGSTTLPAGSTTYGSCSMLHCHSDGTFVSTGAALTTSTAPAATWGTTLTCAGCHGNPPSYATGSPKANSHQGPTHAAQTCDVCHDSVTYNATTLAYTPSATLHANGAYNVKTAMGYTYAATGSTCSNAGAAVTGCHTASMTWGVQSTSCLSCHASAQTITAGPLAGKGLTRAAVTAEFGLAYGHKKSGRAAVTDADCCVCHLEGTASTTGTITLNTAYHRNGYIDLRNPDGTGDAPITNISGTAFTFARFSTSYAAGSRTSTSHTSDTDIANVITQKFCVACHDSNGATNTTARTVGGTAQMPFGGVSLGTNYTVANGASIATGGLVDVKTQFTTTNSSYHPVLGPLNRDFPLATRLIAPYNNQVTGRVAAGGTKTLSVVLNCFDCHNTPAPLTRRTIIAHGNATELRGTIYTFGGVSTLCTTCHSGYTVSGTHGAASSGTAWTTTGSSHNVSRNCQDCHGSYITTAAAPARPIPAQNYHGNNALVGGGLWPTVSSRPYAFIRAWGGTAYHRPLRASEFTTGSATCGAGTCPTGGNGGQVGDGSTRTYTPGGSY